LINFIIVTCKIWQKIGLGTRCQWPRLRFVAETETLTIFIEIRLKRDTDTSRDTSRDHLDTKTSRPRLQPCHTGLMDAVIKFAHSLHICIALIHFYTTTMDL